MKLEPLRATALTNVEAGQLINRHLSDIDSIDPALKTDLPYNKYVQKLEAESDTYEKGLARIRKNEATLNIAQADHERDRAVTAFGTAVKLFSLSDNDEEVESARVLNIAFNNFKGLVKMNFEAESLAIDKLVSDLEKSQYAAKIEALGIDRYVTRMKATNNIFKTLFGGRMVETATTEVFDMKVLRKEMFQTYDDFCDYVLSMTKALKTPLFISTLSLLNTARKYYNDLLARRNSKEEEEAPTT